MHSIEVTKEQKELFTDMAKEHDMSVGDFLYKCIRTLRLVFKEWDDLLDDPAEDEPEEKIEKTPAPKYTITFGDKVYTGNSCRELYTNLVEGIGPRKLFGLYTGNASIMKLRFERGDNKKLYRKMWDNNHEFLLYVCFSEEWMWKRIEEFAKDLGVTWSKGIPESPKDALDRLS